MKAHAKKVGYKARMRGLRWESIATASSDKLGLLTRMIQKN